MNKTVTGHYWYKVAKQKPRKHCFQTDFQVLEFATKTVESLDSFHFSNERNWVTVKYVVNYVHK